MSRHRARHLLHAMTLLPALGAIAGCGIQIGDAGRGEMRIESRERERLDIGHAFTTGYFSVDEKNALTVVLLEGDRDAPTAALTVRMFWLPRVGATPIDRTATNASIHYVVFGSSLSNREDASQTEDVGVYSGAGFLYINSGMDAQRLKAGLWEADIRLADRSEGFVDQIGPSLLAGAVRATRDDDRVAATLQRLNRLTSARLGYPRLVQSHAPAHP